MPRDVLNLWKKCIIQFLALLDYVGRAHEIKIRLSFVVRPSSVCGINYLWTYCMGFFQILVLAIPESCVQTFLEFKKKIFWIFYKYCAFSLTWDPMGAKRSKRYSSLKSLLNLFKLFLNFLLISPHKSTVLIFETVSFWFLTNFEIHHYTQWENKKPQLSGKQATVERNGVEFGPQR